MSTHEQYSDIPRGQVVGSYDTYVEAQRAVDFLSDEQFPSSTCRSSART